MLTMAVSIGNYERSFSKLTLMLSYLRASMTKNKWGRLCDLALMSRPIQMGILCNLTGKGWIY